MRQSAPNAFPSQHIVYITLITTLLYLLLYCVYSFIKKKNASFKNLTQKSVSSKVLVIWALVAALGIRIALSVLVEGHKTDINCFTAWGNSLYTNGYHSFYNGSMPDYPPGYMYVLHLMASIATGIFGHGVRDQFGNYDLVYVTIIKLPAIIADLAAAYFIFRLALKRFGFARAFILLALVAFNPLMIYISSGWGQIDQILTIFIALSIFYIEEEKPIFAGLLYGIAILMKPQALMVGPLFAVAYFSYIFDALSDKEKSGDKAELVKRIGKTAAAVAIAVVLIIVTAVPFSRADLPVFTLIRDKYLGTATSYDYASVNAYNIFALFGKNWARVSQKSFIGLSLGALGTIGMVFSVVSGCVMYVFARRRNKNGALYLAAAFTFASLFTLGHYMHERYMFPVLLLLIAAYIYYESDYLMYLVIAYTGGAMLNCLAAFYYSKYHQYHLYWDKNIVLVGSLLNVLVFLAFAALCVYLVFFKRDKAADEPASLQNTESKSGK